MSKPKEEIKPQSQSETINAQMKALNEIYQQQAIYGSWYAAIPILDFAPKKPRKKRVRSPEKTKTAFLKILAGSGYKKELPLEERVAHTDQYGQAEDYTKGKVDREYKRLCGICGDPRCPWSD